MYYFNFFYSVENDDTDVQAEKQGQQHHGRTSRNVAEQQIWRNKDVDDWKTCMEGVHFFHLLSLANSAFL